MILHGKHRIILFFTAFLSAVIIFTGCKKSVPEGEEVDINLTKIEEIDIQENVFTVDGLAHDPFGWDNLYALKEVPSIWWERTPRDPQAGDKIDIAVAAWKDAADMDIWLEWTLNGDIMEPVNCHHTFNLNDSDMVKGKYIGELGPFNQGDKIKYTVCAGKEGIVEKRIGTYSFSVLEWEPIRQITKASIKDNIVVLEGETASLNPKLCLSYPKKGTLKMTVDTLGSSKAREQEKSLATVAIREDDRVHTIYNENLRVELGKEPYTFRLFNESGTLLLSDTLEDGLEILTDGEFVRGVRLNLKTPPDESFYGFGMKYNKLNQRKEAVNTYCVNWYTDQMGETYTPVPFYFVPEKYGLYVDSTYYSKFNIDTLKKDVCVIDVATGGDKKTSVDFYFFAGNNNQIVNSYTDVVGKPVLPPVWAFGPWISANEWNKQSEVMEQLEQTIEHDIPTTVMVLEAWSDEETFYTFNDSEYKAGEGDYVPKLSDFTFKGKWPDPKGMIEELHENGIKVLLWQIPVLKHSATATLQSIRDQNYAQEKGYVLKHEDGSAYRIPDNTWFGNSYMVDFTNKKATEWFLSKRKYLLKELGIDGFKTDGGEFVWGRDIISYDNTKGDELRNAYPDLYAQAYFDYARQINTEAITFSRAGGAYMQNHPICWVGDQKSTQKAFQDAMHATLSASMSGIPFVAWDIAGFSGDIPNSNLYQRAVAQAAFSPIMQIHSESSGDPIPSQARTPWNMAERKESTDCLENYRYFTNVRMNLLPYIYSEARHSSLTGEPLMRSMAYAFPKDKNAHKYEYQYLFGRNILVAPIVSDVKKEIEVYLPEGLWYGLFDNKQYESGVHTIECSFGELPVFVKEGTVLPMNLNEEGKLGGSIGNNMDSYKNLTFRIYSGNGSYHWYDYVSESEIEIIASSDKNEVVIKDLNICTVIERVGETEGIRVNGIEKNGQYDSSSNITRYDVNMNLQEGKGSIK